MISSAWDVWERLRSSYWFIPGLMSAGAMGLAFLLVWGDISWARDVLSEVPWLASSRPEGARALLSTIAGSMITVAGVTFSITIAAVAYVSSQLGPRVLDTFMRDRGNQITLGTFIATFIYCILVLRNIRSPGEGDAVGFVPQVAVLTGFVLALVSVAVLIYFIHHVPIAIHASHVAAAIGSDLVRKVEQAFPEPRPAREEEVEEAPPAPPLPDDLEAGSARLRSRGDGYITAIDFDGLMELAERHDLIVDVRMLAGAFVRRGQEVARVYPGERLDDSLADRLLDEVSTGNRRTQAQDVLFLVNELVEIAGRALSPGINDPFTAVTCLDWIGAGLSRALSRTTPAPYGADGEGRLRVIVPVIDFPLLAREAFVRVRPYVETDRNAALHMMGVLGGLLREARRSQDRLALVEQADALLEGGRARLLHDADREALRRAHRMAVSGASVDDSGDETGHEPRVDASAASD